MYVYVYVCACVCVCVCVCFHEMSYTVAQYVFQWVPSEWLCCANSRITDTAPPSSAHLKMNSVHTLLFIVCALHYPVFHLSVKYAEHESL